MRMRKPRIAIAAATILLLMLNVSTVFAIPPEDLEIIADETVGIGSIDPFTASGTAVTLGKMCAAGTVEDLTVVQVNDGSLYRILSVTKKFTCDGKDISPELKWSDAPAGTESFALIVDDPDAPDPAAPKMTWVHWVLYNLPAYCSALREGIPSAELPEGALDGLNDWNKSGYGGPCPPIGKHRYFHKLYALDVVLPDLKEPTKADLEKAMEGHILEKAELVGVYQR